MSSTFTLFFEPLDVLQFRDARPFDLGLHVHARSAFPLPSVFLGAIRTALFRQVGVDFRTRPFRVPPKWAPLLGDATTSAAFSLRGPLLASRARRDGAVEPLFPAPADLYRHDSGTCDEPREFGVLERAAPEEWGFRRWRWTGRALEGRHEAVPWTSAELGKHGAGTMWLTPDGARAYFAHAGAGPLHFAEGEALSADDVFQHESRVGIAREDRTLATREGLFYVTTPFRLHADAERTYGFAVDVTLPSGPEMAGLPPAEAEKALGALDGRVIPLGGEARRAVVRVSNGALLPRDLTGEGTSWPAGRKRKLWLLAPLPWGDGSTPAAFAVAERDVRMGGFDLALGAPRPLLRALPAGTVLVTDRDVRESLDEVQRRAGYGTALVKGLEESEP